MGRRFGAPGNLPPQSRWGKYPKTTVQMYLVFSFPLIHQNSPLDAAQPVVEEKE